MPVPIIVVHDEPETGKMAASELCAAGLRTAGTFMRVLATQVDFGAGKLNGVAHARMLRFKRLGIKAVFAALPTNRINVDDDDDFVPMLLDAPILGRDRCPLAGGTKSRRLRRLILSPSPTERLPAGRCVDRNPKLIISRGREALCGGCHNASGWRIATLSLEPKSNGPTKFFEVHGPTANLLFLVRELEKAIGSGAVDWSPGLANGIRNRLTAAAARVPDPQTLALAAD